MICAVIPTLNPGNTLPVLLQDLRPHVSRIVVSDGGSSAKVLSSAVQNGALIAMGSSGRGQQLRRGASWAAGSDWLFIVHADCRLPEDWHERARAHIKSYPDKAGYFDLKFDSSRLSARILEALVRWRCALFGLPYGDQGLLISRKLYDAVGGYEAIPLFEDVAIIRALGKARIRRLGAPIFTNADKYERDGFFRRGWRNFKLLRRYLNGESVERLLTAYS